MRAIILYNPLNGKVINHNDEFVDEESDARVFYTIIAADAYSWWYEHVYGVLLYAKLKDETSHR